MVYLSINNRYFGLCTYRRLLASLTPGWLVPVALFLRLVLVWFEKPYIT